MLRPALLGLSCHPLWSGRGVAFAARSNVGWLSFSASPSSDRRGALPHVVLDFAFQPRLFKFFLSKKFVNVSHVRAPSRATTGQDSRWLSDESSQPRFG